MRLTSEQTKRIMECIAQEMGVELGDMVIIGDGEGIVVDSGGFKSPNEKILHARIMQDIIRGAESFEKVPWEPGKGDRYYSPCPSTPSGVGSYVYGSDVYDTAIRERVGIYRTQEEAIQKARELGWVE